MGRDIVKEVTMGDVANDPEINAMVTLKGALDVLDQGSRHRVLRWAYDRYGMSDIAAAEPAVPSKLSPRPESLLRDQLRDGFSDIADLYAAANPSTDGEKVLVVGYWF